MKKYSEIMEEINETRKRINEISEEMEGIKRQEKSLVAANSFKEKLALREERKNELEELDGRFVALALEEENAKIAVKILRNNAQIALFHEVMPEIISVLMKYKGKQYGEKTREKIRNEVKEKTGCGFYLSCSTYSQECTFYSIGKNGGVEVEVKCATKHDSETKEDKRILLDNKVQEIAFEDFQLCYINRNYVENVSERVEELRELRSQALAKQKELEEICSKYNSLAAGDMKNINARDHIYGGML